MHPQPSLPIYRLESVLHGGRERPEYQFNADERRFIAETNTVEVAEAALRAAAEQSGSKGYSRPKGHRSFQPIVSVNNKTYPLPSTPDEEEAQRTHDVAVAVWRRARIALG